MKGEELMVPPVEQVYVMLFGLVIENLFFQGRLVFENDHSLPSYKLQHCL